MRFWRRHLNFASATYVMCAQLLVLVAFGLALQFVLRTSGGSVFLFSALAPLLILLAIAIVAAHAISAFRKRHTTFIFEKLRPGEVVFRQGDPAECVYFIQSGDVEVVRRHRDGKEERVAQLGAGDFFGEVGLLSDQRRSATVRALAETQLALLGKENFRKMLLSVAPAREHILDTARRRVLRKGSAIYYP